MLDLKDISVTFHANTVNERKALDHLSFHVEDGDFISVLGTNGAGKSTLLNVISERYRVTPGQFCWMERISQLIPNTNGQEKSAACFRIP